MEKKNCAHCAERKTERQEKDLSRLIKRLNRIEGQIRGLRGMLENGAYCADILTQSSAAAAALNSFNGDLLSCHVHTCVARDIRNGKDETIDELMDLIYKFMK